MNLQDVNVFSDQTCGVLVVDDDEDVREELLEGLAWHGFRAIGARSGQDALAVLAHSPDVGVMLTDLDMPGMTGLELAKMAQSTAKIAVVLITGRASPEIVRQARQVGVFEVLPKPSRFADVTHALQAARARSVAAGSC